MIPHVDPEPRVLELLTFEQMTALVRLAVPHWTAYISGPVPLGESEPFRVVISGIVMPTQADALEAVEYQLKRLCSYSGFEYDEDQWHLQGIFLTNGN